MSSHVTAVAKATEQDGAEPDAAGHHGADRTRGGEAPGEHDNPEREGERAQVERDEDPGRVVDALEQGDHLAALELRLRHLPDHELDGRHTREGEQPDQRQPATDVTRRHVRLADGRSR